MRIEGRTVHRIHALGVGGVGVGPLAACLQQQGYEVSGLDASENSMTAGLRALGIAVQIGADAPLPDVDAVFYSSAIQPDHPQFQEAQRRGIPLLKRAAMLAHLAALRTTVAVTGTHGKTTTTALCAHLLTEADWDPSYMVGGLVENTQRYMRWGEGTFFALEADESDASLLCLKPQHAVVTNIEADHMETYGDLANLKSTFLRFMQSVPDEGVVVLNADDPVCCALAPSLTCRVVFFSTVSPADYQACSVRSDAWGMHFDVRLPTGDVFPMRVSQPGKHNVMNAMAALALWHDLGMPLPVIRKALACFKGVGRRLSACGRHTFNQVAVPMVNDYGHHPTEVAASIEAIRAVYPEKRLLMVFQPHRYTRTRDCFQDFVRVLQQVDQLILMPTYAASEPVLKGAASADLAATLQGKVPVVLCDDEEALLAVCDQVVQKTDVLVLQGAGSVGVLPEQWAARCVDA